MANPTPSKPTPTPEGYGDLDGRSIMLTRIDDLKDEDRRRVSVVLPDGRRIFPYRYASPVVDDDGNIY
jgi:hypothetical protein